MFLNTIRVEIYHNFIANSTPRGEICEFLQSETHTCNVFREFHLYFSRFLAQNTYVALSRMDWVVNMR